MNAREFKRHCKYCGTIYSDSYIDQKIAEISSFKRWEICNRTANGLFEVVDRRGRVTDYASDITCGLFYNRITGEFLTTNFEVAVIDNIEQRIVLRSENSNQASISILPPQSEENYFTAGELARIENIHNSYNLQEMKSYGFGDQIYNVIGVLKDGDDDTSMTIGFEEESSTCANTCLERTNLVWFDYRLGHLEKDSSISGYEFDSHVFTWNKLIKCKPLFEKLFSSFAKNCVQEDNSAGQHIHIGRNAFHSEEAFKKFYFIVNCANMRANWERVARRVSGSYYSYSSLEPNNLQHLNNSIQNHSSDHGVAVNQQHSSTYEVRIFRSTMSVDILYGQIELIKNLVDFCNSNDNIFTFQKILHGQYVRRFLQLIGTNANALMGTADLSFIAPMTRDELERLVHMSIEADNAEEAIRLINAYRNQGGRR